MIKINFIKARNSYGSIVVGLRNVHRCNCKMAVSRFKCKKCSMMLPKIKCGWSEHLSRAFEP
jgi:hypothetical protein